MSDKKNISISKIGGGIAGLALLLVIIFAVNMIISNLPLRVDLTGEKLYTLSKGSKEILAKLDNEVTLKFYFSSSSREMPMALKTYANQVKDLLKEYEIAGKGNVVLEAYDTKPDSDAEEWAQRSGIGPQQTSMLGSPVYFGLAALNKESDTEEVIAGFSPRTESTLEYDITRLITRVAWPEKPVLGVMSSLSVLGAPPNPMMMQRGMPQDKGWMAFQDLRKDYTVREVPTSAESIDDDIKALIVIHPKNLSDEALFAIDQFVMRGGRLIVCVDPFSIADIQSSQQQQNPMMRGMGGPGQPGPSTLGKLFDAWGVGFDTTKIVADISCSTKLNGGNGQVEDNPTFLSLTKANLADEDLLTAQLSQVMLPFAGALQDNTASELIFTPMVNSSTDNACMVDQMNAQLGMSAIRAQLKPDGKQRIMAARLQGEFKTAFVDGSVGSATNKVENLLSSGKSTVMVFADSDFLQDNFCVQIRNSLFGQVAQPINNNLTLFANTVEQFAGREELIGVRSRGQFNRPFTKVDKLEAKAMKQWQAEEERLESTLKETQQRLAELQKQKTGNQLLILSEEQQVELEKFQEQQAKTRKELKDVRKNLNKEIENLGRTIKVFNIGLIPLLIILFGIFRGVSRKKR